MITLLLILIPLFSSLLILSVPARFAKIFAFAASFISFAVTLAVFISFPVSADYQYLIDYNWIPSLGIHFKVGIDGISILMVLLTTFLTPLIILSARNEDNHTPVFYALILFMEMALTGVFVSLDGFLFYIFWELALIPIYFICLLWGGVNRVNITIKFFIYTLTGSLFMLVALIILYLHTPNHTFDINDLYHAGRSLDSRMQGILFLFFILAFGIKMPIFPLHTWQPDTYTTAPAQGSMLLSGIMLKMGIYGAIRWLLPMLPEAVHEYSVYVMWFAIAGVVYASVIAITRSDMKRLIAYSSIAHVGLIAAGIFAFNIQGLQGGIVQMLSHGVNVCGLFFVADIIQNRTKTREIPLLGGIRSKAPMLATAFLIIMLGAVALPLTDGFVGEFLLINGVFHFSPYMAALGGLTIILGAVYMFRAYQRTALGETSQATDHFTDLTLTEKAVLIPLVIMVLFIGIFPQVFLNISEPAVVKLLSGY
ncbi:MAG: NADH-quinone oxidoreductase subunit M [Bacteroidia bacterium]|nr:NADH-quinone oxidoreductase subunit M [Bacteroidia bacterium]